VNGRAGERRVSESPSVHSRDLRQYFRAITILQAGSAIPQWNVMFVIERNQARIIFLGSGSGKS
jgi:hypothetical protein